MDNGIKKPIAAMALTQYVINNYEPDLYNNDERIVTSIVAYLTTNYSSFLKQITEYLKLVNASNIIESSSFKNSCSTIEEKVLTYASKIIYESGQDDVSNEPKPTYILFPNIAIDPASKASFGKENRELFPNDGESYHVDAAYNELVGLTKCDMKICKHDSISIATHKKVKPINTKVNYVNISYTDENLKKTTEQRYGGGPHGGSDVCVGNVDKNRHVNEYFGMNEKDEKRDEMFLNDPKYSKSDSYIFYKEMGDAGQIHSSLVYCLIKMIQFYEHQDRGAPMVADEYVPNKEGSAMDIVPADAESNSPAMVPETEEKRLDPDKIYENKHGENPFLYTSVTTTDEEVFNLCIMLGVSVVYTGGKKYCATSYVAKTPDEVEIKKSVELMQTPKY